jgi:hypothetical protein
MVRLVLSLDGGASSLPVRRRNIATSQGEKRPNPMARGDGRVTESGKKKEKEGDQVTSSWSCAARRADRRHMR